MKWNIEESKCYYIHTYLTTGEIKQDHGLAIPMLDRPTRSYLPWAPPMYNSNHQQYEPQFTRARERQQSRLFLWWCLLVSFTSSIINDERRCWAILSWWEYPQFAILVRWKPLEQYEETEGFAYSSQRISYLNSKAALTEWPWWALPSSVALTAVNKY